MKAGFRGTFVISWGQTRVDGLIAPERDVLELGVSWSWVGDAVRIDGPGSILRLGQPVEAIRRNAARRAHRKARGKALVPAGADPDDPLIHPGFVLTDGQTTYDATLIELGHGHPPLLMFIDCLPPQKTNLWITQLNVTRVGPDLAAPRSDGVICFTPGTRIQTPTGPKPVETLEEGDLVQSRDNGPQEILWIGQRHITGARMFVLPQLRPIRIGPGALGIDRPDNTLLVSPAHRLLVRGPAAQALFNTPEVLVPARHLVNGGTITTDLSVRQVTYIHLLLPRHEVLWANGVETDSFHPADADLSALSASDRIRLSLIDPTLTDRPEHYGGFARRTLTKPEASILMHDAA